MQFKRVTALALIATTVVTLAGCSSLGNFFRNRDFDYSRENVTQSKPLEVPKSVSENPDIHPVLTLPQAKETSFTTSEPDKAESSLLPPGYQNEYDTNYLLQQQMMVVNATVHYDSDNQAKLTIDEPYKLSWELVKEALNKKSLDVKLLKEDKDNSRFVIQSNKDKVSYYVFLSHVKNEFRKTEVSLFDMDEKPVTNDKGNALIKSLEKLISGQKLTQSMLVSTSYGFINTTLGFKYQVYIDDKVASLVFVGEKAAVEKALKQAVESAGYKYVAYNKNDQTVLIKDKKDQSYLLYIYDHTVTGSIFSDMTNWRTFFREEQQQIRVSVFDTKKILLPIDQSRPILDAIAEKLPMNKKALSTTDKS
ncbi:hypothetical protein [Fangia hongkongensis]|uniref:hypothetical protein n=3 Tax=Fangia hongkongensis TaxID=270495 RepID=UPI00036245C5|nr:hypothetical protein [Fangia hongkongensis]